MRWRQLLLFASKTNNSTKSPLSVSSATLQSTVNILLNNKNSNVNIFDNDNDMLFQRSSSSSNKTKLTDNDKQMYDEINLSQKNVNSNSINNGYTNRSSSSSKLFNYFNIYKSTKLKNKKYKYKRKKRSIFDSITTDSYNHNNSNKSIGLVKNNSINKNSLYAFSTTTISSTLLTKSTSNSSRMIMHHHSKSTYDIELETNEYYFDRGVETRGLNEMYSNYKPETGLRTASVLGIMLFLIIFYLFWKNRCKCAGGSNNSDYDMEYWLNYVDEQKIARKNREKYMPNPQLPDKVTNPRQATEAWVIEHRKLWQNAQKKREKEKANRHDDSKFNYLLKSRIKQNLINPNDNFSNQNDNIQDILLKPFRKLIDFKSSRHNNSRFNSRFNHKTRLFQELDAKTQLLINYARIDAVTNAKFNKFTSPQAFTSSYILGQNLGPSAYFIRQHQKQKIQIEQENFNKFQSTIASKLSNPLLDVNNVIDMLVYQGSSNNSRIDLKSTKSNSEQDIVMSDLNQDPTNTEEEEEFKEISQTQIIQKLLLNMLFSTRRRSQSWPRSKRDQLQMNNFNREIRLIYYQNQRKHLVQKIRSRNNKIKRKNSLKNRSNERTNTIESKDEDQQLNRFSFTIIDSNQPTTSKTAAEFNVDLI